jgi:hypothetical protein
MQHIMIKIPKKFTHAHEYHCVRTFASPWTACMNASLFGNAGRDAYFRQHLMNISFEDIFELKIETMNDTIANQAQTLRATCFVEKWFNFKPATKALRFSEP